MSTTEDLKEALTSLADDTEQTAGDLGQFVQTFEQQAQGIAAQLDGTSQGTDQDIAQTFDEASKAVEDAVAALTTAAQAAREHSEGL